VIDDDASGWSAVIPVKALDAAKSRMSAAVPAGELAFAFFADTLAAVTACPTVSEVLVATEDARVGAWARATGCQVVPDGAHPGINAAVAWAAEHRRATGGVAVVVSDLPCLTPAALASVLREAAGHGTSFLADADGTGTAMWFSSDGREIATCFGVDSRAAHVRAGAVDLARSRPDLTDSWTSARRDVDTATALLSAVDEGLGAHSRALLDAVSASVSVRTVLRRAADAIVLVDESGHITTVPWDAARAAGLVDLHRGQRVLVGTDPGGTATVALP